MIACVLCVPPAFCQQDDPFEKAFSITDGDSAIVALVEAAQGQPDHPLAPEALLRAGYLAYVKGDAERAEELFGMAQGAGDSRAGLWRGLALLSAGRADEAVRHLRATGGGGEAEKLALAACEFSEGNVEAGESRCREIIDSGGPYAAVAALLLMRTAPRAVGVEESGRLAELLARRDPLSYESVLARHLPEPETGAEELGEEEIVAEEPVSAEPSVTSGEGRDEPAGEESEGAGGREDGGVEEASLPREFCVQVGAFVDVRNAEALVGDLMAKGYAAVRIESETRRGTLFHCVRVGRFASRDDALAQAQVLERDENIGTQVMESKRQAPQE
jgi:hypothetical protein